jgi:hypothetical protein
MEEHPILKHFNEEQKAVFDILNQEYSANTIDQSTATGQILHYWGEFTSDLPEKFHVNGTSGHQYLECNSSEEAEKVSQELRDSILGKWPDSAEWIGEGWYKWMNHDMKQMTLEFQQKEEVKEKKSWWKKK